MGDILMGSTERGEDINLLRPEQLGFLQNILSQAGPGAGQALQSFINPEEQTPYNEMFQKSIVDPALQYMQKTVNPEIKNAFLGGDEQDSSALNQALAQAAGDLSTSMGSQFSNFVQNQRQQQLQGLNSLLGFGTQRTFEPFMQERQGLAGPIISAAGTIGGAYAGGPAGAAAGSAVGNWLTSYLKQLQSRSGQ